MRARAQQHAHSFYFFPFEPFFFCFAAFAIALPLAFLGFCWLIKPHAIPPTTSTTSTAYVADVDAAAGLALRFRPPFRPLRREPGLRP